MKKTQYAIIAAIAIIIAAAGIYVLVPKEIHEHADFAAYINGRQINFSQDKYMHNESPEQEASAGHGAEDDEKAHMHDLAGWIAHKHAADATWGIFFRNINITFNPACFAFEEGGYCNNATHELRLFVNGQQNNEFGTLPIRDLDKVLISYDETGADLAYQIANVTDDACLYSHRCPERGEAALEDCVTGGRQCT